MKRHMSGMPTEELIIKLLSKRESTFEQINLVVGGKSNETAAILRHMERKGAIASVWKKQADDESQAMQKITRIYFPNVKNESHTKPMGNLFCFLLAKVHSSMSLPYDLILQQTIRRNR